MSVLTETEIIFFLKRVVNADDIYFNAFGEYS